MTDIVDRLRTYVACDGGDLADVAEAADEIERLTATIAGLRESANLRVRYHAAELADVTTERDAAFAMSRCQCATDEACAQLAKLRQYLDTAQRRASALGDEVAGLREDAERYRWLRDKFSRIACITNLAWDAAQAETTKIESLWVMEHFRATDPESTDAAIDAARKGSHADQA